MNERKREASIELSEKPDTNNKNGYFIVSTKKALLLLLLIISVLLAAILLTAILKPSPSKSSPQSASSSAAASSESSEHAEKLGGKSGVNFRLPRSLKPSYYELSVKPYFNVTTRPESYDGFVSIRFSCFENTSKLILHINDLAIDNSTLEIYELAQVIKVGLTKPVYEEKLLRRNFLWTIDDVRQFFIADFGAKNFFQKDKKYMVNIGFKGSLKDDNTGFYASSYYDSDGTRKWLMASLLAPLEARKSFVCFDEPDMKAKFKIKVIHDSSLNAVSNMPVSYSKKINTIDNDYEWVQTEFNETVEMSTYLVALAVSDFKCIKATAKPILSRKIDLGLCARPNAIHQLNFALNIAISALEFFEKLFNVVYPLPKSDHIALPDFSPGAMENWGLITYRESRLLYDSNKTSQSAEQYMVEVIVHELSHMWFGNLVSPKWWNDLWLNEGFARFMQYLGTDFIKPEWKMFDQFMQVWFSTQDLDSVPSSHPVSVDVNNPSEIIEIFDGITYGKGGSVIRMLNYMLGSDTFNKGITKYLNRYQYDNADQSNLWEVLNQQARSECKMIELNLTEIMRTWTEQMGHPLIKITALNNTHVLISQKHFLYDNTSKPVENKLGYTWYVPFTYAIESVDSLTSKSSKFNMSNLYNQIVWLYPNETEKIIQLEIPLSVDNFLIANLDASGFYRVHYDPLNWRKIVLQLVKNKESIPIKMRGQIINDVFSLAQAQQISPIRPLELIRYLRTEIDLLTWDTAINRVNFYINMLETTEIFGEFNKYLLELVEPIYIKLTWQNNPKDTWLDRQLRTKILDFTCARDSADCVNKAKEYYNSWMLNEKNNTIPKDFRSFVYCTAIKYGSQKEWNFASRQYDLETDSNAKKEIQNAMACTREPWLINRFLNDQLNNSKVRKQDTMFGLRYAATKPLGNIMTWDFIKTNWKELYDRYGNAMTFAQLLNDLSSKFNTENSYDEFVKFFNGVSTGSATREVRISTEKIRGSINWMKNNYEQITAWFNERKS